MRNTDIDNRHQKTLNFIHVANEKLTTLSADKHYNRYMRVCVCVCEGGRRFCISLYACGCVRAFGFCVYMNPHVCVCICVLVCVFVIWDLIVIMCLFRHVLVSMCICPCIYMFFCISRGFMLTCITCMCELLRLHGVFFYVRLCVRYVCMLCILSCLCVRLWFCVYACVCTPVWAYLVFCVYMHEYKMITFMIIFMSVYFSKWTLNCRFSFLFFYHPKTFFCRRKSWKTFQKKPKSMIT